MTCVADTRWSEMLLRPERWPALAPYGALRALRFIASSHLWWVEPLSVAAFASAVLAAPVGTTVLDIGANVGAYALVGAALNRSAIAVELQPGCRACLRFHAAQLDEPARLRIVTGYVSRDVGKTIIVPRRGCEVMASPSAVAGRWPHGLLAKETRTFLADPPPPNETRVVRAVRPRGLVPKRGAIVLKIDTEGYEIQALEALREVWSRVVAVVLEVQPNAWTYANTGPSEGMATLRALMRQQRFSAAALPHPDRRIRPPPAAIFDPRAQTWLDADGLAAELQAMLDAPGKSGWFREFALMRAPR